MIYFIGAGSGAKDLITVRGARLLSQADLIIYAGSLVNRELLEYAKPEAQILDSSKMTLEGIIAAMRAAEASGQMTARLHTGDSSIYGAVREQFDQLEAMNIPYEVCPGVSSFCGAAAALKTEYTLPGLSQTVIITRMAGKTKVPEAESLASLAAHQASLILFLSAGLLPQTQRELLKGLCAGHTGRHRLQSLAGCRYTTAGSRRWRRPPCSTISANTRWFWSDASRRMGISALSFIIRPSPLRFGKPASHESRAVRLQPPGSADGQT